MTLIGSEADLEEGWKFGTVPDITGGLDRSVSPAQLDELNSPFLHSVRKLEGRLEIDTGYVTKAGTVRGRPRLSFEWERQAGTKEVVLVTNLTFYKLINAIWDYISNGTSTTVTATEPAAETSIAVASDTGFADGDFIGITLDDGTQHKTTVNGTPTGNVIIIDDGLPSQTTSGKAVVLAAILTGTDANQVDHTVIPSSDWFVFTNNTDNVKRYDGTTIEDIPNLPSSGNTKCRTVALFVNHLLLGATTEGGTAHPQRVRRADTGDATNWTTGNAGFEDLFGSSDPIVKLAAIGPYMAVYRSKSIYRGEFIGTAELLFKFEESVGGVGIISVNGMAEVDGIHYVFGNEMLFEYRGGFQVTALSIKVNEALHGVATGEIDHSIQDMSFVVGAEEIREVWFFYGVSGDAFPSRSFRYRIDDKGWFPRRYATEMTGGNPITTSGSTLRWTDLVGDWTQLIGSWLSLGSASTTNELLMLVGASPNQVYTYDFVAPKDNGSAIAYEYQTKDFWSQHKEFTVDRIDFLAKGTSITVSYSKDEGATWIVLGTVSPGASYTRMTIWRQFIVERVRFRWTGSMGFGLGWYGVKFREEGLKA